MTIQNASSENAFKYHVDVQFAMSNDTVKGIWGDPFWTDDEYVDVTVGAGKSRKVVVDASSPYSNRTNWRYGCQVTQAQKSLP